MSVATSSELDATFAKIQEIVKTARDAEHWTEYSGSALTRAGAGIYCQQHGIFTRHSRRVWAYVVGNCPEVEVRRFIVRENLYEEEGIDEISHYLKLVRMAKALGVSEDEMNDATPLPTTRGALLIWETLTKDRHWILGCAAKGALEYRTTSGLEGKRWMATLGLSREDADFWLMHHEIDAVHGSGAFDFVMKYLPHCPNVTPADVIETVTDSMVAWRVFRDGIAAAARAAA